jgi:hypothetical protein
MWIIILTAADEGDCTNYPFGPFATETEANNYFNTNLTTESEYYWVRVVEVKAPAEMKMLWDESVKEW